MCAPTSTVVPDIGAAATLSAISLGVFAPPPGGAKTVAMPDGEDDNDDPLAARLVRLFANVAPGTGGSGHDGAERRAERESARRRRQPGLRFVPPQPETCVGAPAALGRGYFPVFHPRIKALSFLPGSRPHPALELHFASPRRNAVHVAQRHGPTLELYRASPRRLFPARGAQRA